MKAVILTGGKGTRLGENARHSNKHLLPVIIKPFKEFGGRYDQFWEKYLNSRISLKISGVK